MSIITTKSFDYKLPQSTVTPPIVPTLPTVPTMPVMPKAPRMPSPPWGFAYPQQKNLYSDYNDSNQINSILDAVVASVNKKIPVKTDMGILNDIPILRGIPASIDAIRQVGWDAVMEGDWKAAGLNQLINAGEILDIVANPAKGFISGLLEGGVEEGWHNLKKAAWDRYNYDYDTGNFALDIAGEIVTDPINWVTFGVKSLVAKGVSTTRSVLTNSIQEAAIKAGVDMSVGEAAKNAYLFAKEIITHSPKAQAEIVNKLANTVSSNAAIRKAFAETFLDTFKSASMTEMSKGILVGTSRLVRTTDIMETSLTKLAFAAPYVAFKSIKAASDPVINYIKQGLKAELKNASFITERGTLDILKYDEGKNTVIKHGKITDNIDEAVKTYEDFTEQSVRQLKYDLRELLDETSDDLSRTDALNNFFTNTTKRTPEEYLAELQKVAIKNPGKFDELIQDIDQAIKKATLKDDLKVTYAKKKAVNEAKQQALKTQKVEATAITTATDDMLKGVDKVINKLNTQKKFSDSWFNKAHQQVAHHLWYYLNALPIQSEHFARLQRASLPQFNTAGEVVSRIEGKSITNIVEKTVDDLAKLKDAPNITPKMYADEASRMISAIEYYVKDSVKAVNELASIPEEVFNHTKSLGSGTKKMIEGSKKLLALLKKESTKDNPLAFINERALTFDTEFTSKMSSLYKDIFSFFTKSGNNTTVATHTVTAAKLVKYYSKEVPKLNALFILKDILGTSTLNMLSLYNKIKNLPEESFRKYVSNAISNAIKNGSLTADKKSLLLELRNDKLISAESIVKKLNQAEYATMLSILEDTPVYKATKPLSLDESLQEISVALRQSLDDPSDILLISSQFDELLSKPMSTKTTTVTTQGSDLVTAFTNWVADNRQLFKNTDASIQTMTDYMQNIQNLYKQLEAEDFTEDVASQIVAELSKLSNYCASVVRKSPSATTFSELQGLVSNTQLAEAVHKVFEMQTDRMLYQLKLEQNVTMDMLLNDTVVNDFISKLCNPQDDFGAVIQQLIQSGHLDAVRLQKTVQNYANYKAFLIDLTESIGEPHKDFLEAFQSTIQRYARMNPQEILENFDMYYNYIINGSELYLNSRLQKVKLDLDTLAVTLDWTPEERLIVDGLPPHNAWGDSVRTTMIRKKLLADEFEKLYPGYNVIDFDIETSALKYYTGEVTQIGFHSPELELKGSFVTNPVFEPTETVKRLVKDSAEDVKMKRELDLLYKVGDMINEAYTKSDKIVINMHNGYAFDKPFILNRLNYYYHMLPNEQQKIVETIAAIKSVRFEDSLKLLRKKNGFVTVDDFTKEKLKEAFRYFVDNQQGQSQLIRPVGPEFAGMLKDAASEIENLVKAGQTSQDSVLVASQFRQATDAIYTAFSNISKTNADLGMYFIDKAIFDLPEIQKEFGLNITQFLHSFADDADAVGLSWLAVRKGVDEATINDVFAKQIGQQLHMNELRYRNNLAQGIVNNYNKLKHTTRLIREQHAIKDMLNMFIKSAENIEGVPQAFKELAVTNNPYLNFAKLQYVANYGFRKVEGYTQLLDAVLDTNKHSFPQFTEVKEYLTHPGVVREKPFKDTGELTEAVDLEVRLTQSMIRLRNKAVDYLASDDMLISQAYYQTFKNAADDFQDLRDRLDAVSENMDHNNVARAVVNRRATSLKETSDMLHALTERHKNITTLAQHARQFRKYQALGELMMQEQVRNTLTMTNDDLFKLLVNIPDHNIVIQKAMLQDSFFKTFKDNLDEVIKLEETDNAVILHLDHSEMPVQFVEHDGRTYYSVHGNEVTPPIMKALDIEGITKAIFTDPEDAVIASKFMSAYNKLSDLVGDLQTGYSPHVGTMGEVASKTFYETKYSMLPDSVKKKLLSQELLLPDKVFDSSMFNTSVLGLPEFRRAYGPYAASDGISTMISTMKMQSHYLEAKMEYANMCVDKSISINGPVFKDTTDQEMLDTFKSSGEWRLVALVEDEKLGARLVDLDPKTLTDIQTAKNLGAVMMSYQTYSKAFSTINQFRFKEGALGFVQKMIYLYKTGFLMTPGAIMRNFLDTPLKNFVNAKGDFTGMTQAYGDALPLYMKYNQTIKDLTQFADGDMYKGQINSKTINDFFDKVPSALDKKTFSMVYGFFVDGPSGGQVKELTDYLDKDVNFQKWGKFSHILNQAMYPNQVIEQVSRLAEYLWLTEKGVNTNKAYYEIAKTHFDYAIKTRGDLMKEIIFPFYTFTINNINFWTEQLFKTPWLGALMNDTMKPIFDFDSYTPEEMKYNWSLQQTILNGNMRLGDIHTLKLNPSFMDVYNLFTNPAESIKNKLMPLLQGATNLAGTQLPEGTQKMLGIPDIEYQKKKESFLNMVPLLGPVLYNLLVQTPKNQARGGNPLMNNPVLASVFGTVKPFKPLQRKTYTKRTFSKFPKKPRRAYAKKFYFKKYYPPKKPHTARQTYAEGSHNEDFYRKLYTKTGKSRLKLMTNISPQTIQYRLKDMYYYFK